MFAYIHQLMPLLTAWPIFGAIDPPHKKTPPIEKENLGQQGKSYYQFRGRLDFHPHNKKIGFGWSNTKKKCGFVVDHKSIDVLTNLNEKLQKCDWHRGKGISKRLWGGKGGGPNQ